MIDKINNAGREVVEADLIQDQDFIESAKKVWQMDNGISKQFKGSDQEAVQYGLDRMAKFNYNISLGTVPDMIHIGSQDMDTKIAFAYLMDTYDDKDITWAGVGRFVKETGTDITNYITLGGGGAVSQVAKIPAKEALKKTIMSQITKHLAKPIVQSVPVGAGYAGGFNVAQQKVKKEAGLQKGISGKEAAVSAAVGAVVAPVAVKGVQVAGKSIKKAGQLAGKGIDYINREGEEAMAQAAGGGTPNEHKISQQGHAKSKGFWGDILYEQNKGDEHMKFTQPVKLKDGGRLSGFSDKDMTTFYGYDKNGEQFTIEAQRSSEYLLNNIDDEAKTNPNSIKTIELVRQRIRDEANNPLTVNERLMRKGESK